MTRLREHIEEVRVRLGEISKGELALVRALGEALSLVDQKLLNDVRQVTAEHEARRGAILSELQTLAARIGSFPAPHEPVAAIGTEAGIGAAAPPVPPAVRAGGDWREATKAIDDELDFLELDVDRNGYRASHATFGGDRDVRFGT